VDEVKRRVYKAAEGYDVIVVEVGGTVGDIESLPFLEAIRQMKSDLGVDDTAFIHLTFVPYISSAGELKTKPSQHSVRDMLALGLQPDVLVCRSENSIDEESKNKISLFTNVARECVIGLEDVNSIYLVPDILREHKLDEVILKKLNLSKPPAELKQWKKVANIINAKSDTKIKVGLVCKYNKLKDAYLSLIESVKHASMHFGTECEIIMIDSEDNHLELVEELKTLDGIIVPGGFGKRGVEGKIEAIKFARENKIPFLGICLGMQLVVIEYARNICNLSDANSSEFDKNSNNQVIGLIEQWQVDSEESKIVNKENLGGTMRLGAQNIKLKENLIFSNAYKSNLISERHRHRFEFNNNYKKVLEENNLIISGISEFGGLVETVELSKKDHPWFAACQFHPEFTSSPINGHPLFISFLEAVINK
jgi:CTP synthase